MSLGLMCRYIRGTGSVVAPATQEHTMTHTVENLFKTVSLVRKYAHRWSANPSHRMYGWVDLVNTYKDSHPAIWEEYSARFNNGFTGWDAYDLLA